MKLMPVLVRLNVSECLSVCVEEGKRMRERGWRERGRERIERESVEREIGRR